MLASSNSFGQQKYWVVFTDKQDVNFNPYSYFDSKTIEKREELGISLVQFTDLPLNQTYCRSVEEFGSISSKSRWLNAVSVRLNSHEISLLSNQSFVEEIVPIQSLTTTEIGKSINITPDQLSHINDQVKALGGDIFHEHKIDGRGVRIAVFDGGFPAVDTLSIFSHIRDEGRIIKTYDFVKKTEFVYDYNSHGTSVLACIAGFIDSTYFGLGTGAEFLLARTEVKPEIFEEEENWAAAMEWADKNGADIISSSLGYTSDRYFPRQMDGKTVFVSKIANIAARKGMLVVNAAGNDGDSDWEVIGAPADADSVLSVGGISSKTGYHIDFSSYGPTFDGRLKPNVVAFGDVVTSGKNSLKTAHGTSFSAPLVSGFAACVMQLNPDWDNMKVFNEIQNSGHLYPYYDYAHGYGVPQAAYFLEKEQLVEESFSFVKQVDILEIKLIIKIHVEENIEAAAKRFESDNMYLYYHIADVETGKIRKYALVEMLTSDLFTIPLSDINEGEMVRAHFKGFTNEYIF